MQMAVPGALSTMTWLGRGPHENYWDRHTGAAVGRYSGRVEDLVHDYVRPQENANRTDVRWVALTDASGAGLLASGLHRGDRPIRRGAPRQGPGAVEGDDRELIVAAGAGRSPL
jgi:hypothetical protein